MSYNTRWGGRTVTGASNDPGWLAALPHITAANVLSWRVDRAKYDFFALPPLTSPSNYATARNLAVSLKPGALLTVANANAFIAAVAAARALIP